MVALERGSKDNVTCVVVAFDGPDGRGEDTAAYLVGCDGPQSTVRTLAGIHASDGERKRFLDAALALPELPAGSLTELSIEVPAKVLELNDLAPGLFERAAK